MVLLLVIALVVTRRRGTDGPAAADGQPDGGSFLDDAPQDTFSGLGKAEQPVEDVTVDPAVQPAHARPRASQAGRERQPQPGGLGLDWGPDLSVKTTSRQTEPAAPASPDSAAAPAPADDETEITGELAAVRGRAAPTRVFTPTPEAESGQPGGRHAARATR